jgi:uncharacterized membrane protein YfcA
MAVGLGFIIAVAIGLTGVGAGSLTTPLLILLLAVPAQIAVGTALIFGAVVKLITAPVYMARNQVNWRALLFLVAGGLPGVLLGSLVLHGIRTSVVMTIIGATIMTVAAFNLFRPTMQNRSDRTEWLAAVALPIGAETGFSSAGAGALGGLALLSLAPLTAVEVVGTDLCFGFVLSTVAGGIHAFMGALDKPVLYMLLAGGIPGAVVGAMLASRIPSRKLRMGLSLAMAVLGAQICWKGVTAL